MPEGYEIVDVDEIGTEPFPESGIEHAKLTEALGAQDMRVNALILEPGQVVGYHTHERQEEIYVCTQGPGEVYVDGERHDVPEVGVVRIRADVPRQLLNTSEADTHRWVMFGAPTVGSVEDFGEYKVATDGYDAE